MKRAVRKMLENPAFAQLLDPGLGKTAITLAAFDILREQGIVRRMLVIAPLRVCYDVWPAEMKKWKDFNHLQWTLLHGPKKEERLKGDADVFIMNPEGVDWLAQTVKKKGKKLESTREWDWPEMLVVDESTRFKHHKTGRFKSMDTILGNFERRYDLTGTPAPNGYHDLWGQFYLLDHGERLGENISWFRRKWFVQTWEGHGWEIRDEDAEREIEERIADISLRLAAEDYLKLPPLIQKNIGVELSTAVKAKYLQLEKEFFLQMAGGEVTATNAGVRSSKLRQAANGRVYLDDDDQVVEDAGADAVHERGRKIGKLHKAKVEALRDLTDELQGQPLMVAYEFRHDLDALQDEFGKNVPVLGAGTTPTKGRNITRAWNQGRVPLLFAHPQSAGHGLNLQDGGNNICWFSLTWNLEHHTQLIRRQWRLGQKKPVFVYYLLAKGTIDAHVAETVADKDATQKKLLAALNERLT
jgi:SNF2 family DNA or RNA helicase